MKKQGSNFKTKGIVAKTLALVMLITCIAIPVLGSTESKDGIEVTLETDKDSYLVNEEVKISVNVKNTGETSLSNVTVELKLPEGVKLAEGSNAKITFDVLGKGETKEQTVLSKAAGAEDKKDIIVDGSVQTGDGTKNIILGLVICEIIAAVIVIVLKNKKLRKGIAMLSVTIVFASTFTMVAYAVMQFEISKEIEVGGVKKEIIAVVSYDKNEEKDNIKPSPDDEKETDEKETVGGENESTETETDKPGNDDIEEASVKWEILNGDTLHIYGKGEMEDYNLEWAGDVATHYRSGVWEYVVGTPWWTQRNNIKKIVIDEGVTSIGDYAFYDCDSLTDAEIPNSITSIGTGAFSDCISLTEIKISNSVTSIGDYAFEGCSSLTGIEIPNSVTSIENYTFVGCKSLTNIKLPNSLISIGDYAFEGCSSLTSIEIPNSVTSIEKCAFEGCSNLTSIEIPNSVTNIGERAFYGTKWLASKQAENSLVIINNILVDGTTVTGNIEIPNGVTSIGTDAFNDCISLTEIKISNSLTSIGERAFYGCSSLTGIEIPNSVTGIGDSAFDRCYSLKIIYGTKDSYAEIYAKKNGYTFVEK